MVMWTIFVWILVSAIKVSHAGVRWKNGLLPPGYELIDGEAVDITNKVIQMTTSQGTEYFAFDDARGKPLYIRDGFEKGWHFIVFDDPYNQDPGGGHLIVLQRLTGLSVDGTGKIIYEAFLLSLEKSVAIDVEPYDPQETQYYMDEDQENRKHDSKKINKF